MSTDQNQSTTPNSEHQTPSLTVYYDASCPKCRRDREAYERLLGSDSNKKICWLDITGKDRQLHAIGIDPEKALTELHIQDDKGNILSELDAYIVLMNKVPRLKPIAWLIGLPLIRPLIAKLYHWLVDHRLRNREGQ